MRLWKEVLKDLTGDLSPRGRCVFLVGGGGYFQGVKAVEEFSDRSVAVRFLNGVLKVAGESLSVGKYYGGDLELSGKISALRFIKNGEEEKDGLGACKVREEKEEKRAGNGGDGRI